AFFYAGAASIVATMWDVADDPTRRLVPDFYRRRAAGAGKAEALRDAQLRLLRDLRAGRVRIGTGDDAVRLPENPFFWAAFVLTGEPCSRSGWNYRIVGRPPVLSARRRRTC